MNNWMRSLSTHYEKIRSTNPNDSLLLLFDIDGTILDDRYMIRSVLQAYDRTNNTQYFTFLEIENIGIRFDDIIKMIVDTVEDQDEQDNVVKWYRQFSWTPMAIRESHQPFRGVLEVIRWFQLQPLTSVGLNTGRPESLRFETLNTLNELGKEYRVSFSHGLLHMRQPEHGDDIGLSKLSGINYFQNAGYRVFGFVDNEPENLKRVESINESNEILLLQADTILQSQRPSLLLNTTRGKSYDLTELIFERELPGHIQFVKHGVNDWESLTHFFSSDINWAECDVRLDPVTESIILRHDSYETVNRRVAEKPLELRAFLQQVKEMKRGAKLDLKEGGSVLNLIIQLVKDSALDQENLWFNANVERLGKEGFQKLREIFPYSTIQCPVDFLGPLIIGAPDIAKSILDFFYEWGINRVSVSWKTKDKRRIFEQLDNWGLEINIYDVPDLESFLQAALLLPHSLSSRYDYPHWGMRAPQTLTSLKTMTCDLA